MASVPKKSTNSIRGNRPSSALHRDQLW